MTKGEEKSFALELSDNRRKAKIGDVQMNTDIDPAYETRLISNILTLEKRIAALEAELKDFGAWAIEVFGPIGPPSGGKGIEQRITALEEKQYGWVDKRGHIHVIDPDIEKRVAALAQRIDDWISADVTSSSGWEERIATLEDKIK